MSLRKCIIRILTSIYVQIGSELTKIPLFEIYGYLAAPHTAEC